MTQNRRLAIGLAFVMAGLLLAVSLPVVLILVGARGFLMLANLLSWGCMIWGVVGIVRGWGTASGLWRIAGAVGVALVVGALLLTVAIAWATSMVAT